jgi:hypothetical protein
MGRRTEKWSHAICDQLFSDEAVDKARDKARDKEYNTRKTPAEPKG